MDNIDNIVVSSRVRLARNVRGLPFPKRLMPQDERVYSVLLSGVKNAIGNRFGYDFYEMRRLDGVERQALLEQHLVSYDLTSNIDNGSVLISHDKTISIMVNEEDHIRAQCVLAGLNLYEAYDKIDALDDELAKNLDIAFDKRLGYLTSCPTNLGTGMRASVMMFLPALTQLDGMHAIISTAHKLGLTARGMYGEGSDADGYLYQISNEVSLGISEKDILRRVDTFVRKVAENELKAREILFQQGGVQLIDQIARAYGILTNAYMLSSDECMRLLSYVKLGVSHGIIKNIDMATLSNLTDSIGSAEICKEAGKNLGATDRDIERAKRVKETLKR